MTEMYTARSEIDSDSPEGVETAVRSATDELHDVLQAQGISATFEDIARLGHTESWDDEGIRWAQVSWPIESNE